jgi:lipoate-protein ligase A
MWRILDLNAVDGYEMTNLYEAVGRAVSEGLSSNTLILNHPKKPFVNIGYHQLMEKEIDINYAKSKGFDLVRRSIGGGAILDGPWEQDYFVIVNRRSPECPSQIPEFYKKFLKPIMYALKKYELNVNFRPPNDILIGNRKISGNGAITINNSNVLAGDILLDLPVELMTKIIKAPSEKFRDKLAKSISQWLTALNLETGSTPRREEVKSYIVEGFNRELDIEFEYGKITSEEKDYLNELLEERKTDDWIFMKEWGHPQLFSQIDTKGTKIRSGVTLCEATYKAEKLIRITMEIHENKVSEISISGDFFTQPYLGIISYIENKLKGVTLDEEELTNTFREAFNEQNLKVYGAKANDFVKAILMARENIP